MNRLEQSACRQPGAAHGRALAWACLLAVLLPSGPARADVASALPYEVQVARLQSHDGLSLLVKHYRPQASASAGVVLVHDWLSSASACWDAWADVLAGDGFEVLVPDLRGHGESTPDETPRAARARPSRTELQELRTDGTRWWQLFSSDVQEVILVCAGASGQAAPDWRPRDQALRAIVWIGPVGEAAVWEQSLRAPGLALPRLLLVATHDDLASTRVAEALFSRLNDVSELRLFSRGAGGCELAHEPRVREGLRAWLNQLREAAPSQPAMR